MALPPSGTTDEAFLREVDEEYRRDQMLSFWRRYGRLLLIGLVVLLVAVAGWLFYQHQQAIAQEQRGQAFDAALRLVADNKPAQAEPALDKIAQGGDDGYTAMARITLGNLLLARNDRAGAAARFAQVAKAAGLDQAYRDLAVVRQTQAEFDALPPQTVIQRLANYANPESPWFGTAGEMVGAAYLKAGRQDQALRLFRQLGEAGDRVPDSIRQRAGELAKVLSAAPVAAQTQEKKSR